MAGTAVHAWLTPFGVDNQSTSGDVKSPPVRLRGGEADVHDRHSSLSLPVPTYDAFGDAASLSTKNNAVSRLKSSSLLPAW